VYGFIAANDVLRFTGMVLGEVVDEFGSQEDFIGHAGGDNFVIITKEASASAIRSRLKTRFDSEIATHYNFMDRQQGFILAPDENGAMEQTPLMSLAVGMVSPSTDVFSDIREITELAAESRRHDASTASAR